MADVDYYQSGNPRYDSRGYDDRYRGNQRDSWNERGYHDNQPQQQQGNHGYKQRGYQEQYTTPPSSGSNYNNERYERPTNNQRDTDYQGGYRREDERYDSRNEYQPQYEQRTNQQPNNERWNSINEQPNYNEYNQTNYNRMYDDQRPHNDPLPRPHDPQPNHTRPYDDPQPHNGPQSNYTRPHAPQPHPTHRDEGYRENAIQPKLLAQTATRNNNGIAVFGIVAKVDPPVQGRPPPSTLNPQPYLGEGGPASSPTRTQPLTPIMEHPSSPQPYPGGYPQQGNAYHNRDIPNNRNKDSGGYHGYSGVTVASSGGYRDDSSGYGSASTHTERSYDGQRPLGGAKPNLPQKPRLPPGGQKRTPSGPSSPPWQREFGDNEQFEYQQHQRSYNNDKQQQSYNTEPQRNFQQDNYSQQQRSYNEQQQQHQQTYKNEPQQQRQSYNNNELQQQKYRNQPQDYGNDYQQSYQQDNYPQQQQQQHSHWTLQKPNDSHHYRSNEGSGVDSSQIKGVRAVKNLFDKPGAPVPLPPTSMSYGANRYNNARPVPPRPRVTSDRGSMSPTSGQRYEEQQFPRRGFSPNQDLPPGENSRGFPRSPLEDGRRGFPNDRGMPVDNRRGFPQDREPSYDNRGIHQERGQDGNRGGHDGNRGHREDKGFNHERGGLPQDRGQNIDARRVIPQQRGPGDVREFPQEVGPINDDRGIPNDNRRGFPNDRGQDGVRGGFTQQRGPPQHTPPMGEDRRGGMGLPHLPPPPQHSQSMYNLDIPPSNDGRLRSSYSGDHLNNPMVVGIKYPSKQQAQDSTQPPHPYNQPSQPNPQPSDSQRGSYTQAPNPNPQPHKPQTYPPQPQQHHPNQSQSPQSYPPQPQAYKPPETHPNHSQSYKQPPHPHQAYPSHPNPPYYPNNNPTKPQDSDDESNYVPSVVAKSYRSFTNQQEIKEDVVTRSYDQYNRQPPPQNFDNDDWPQPPPPNSPPPPRDHSFPHNTRYDNHPYREPPPGSDDTHGFPRPPRHPYDPDDEDSSEGIDVDAPTPPPQKGKSLWGNKPPSGQMRRAEPAGYQKDYGYERQPGDGLNNELNNQPIVRKQSPPRKPMRNSIKNNSEVPDQGNPPQPANENHPLSHAHSKDRLRVAKGMPSRKPPTRQSSSGNLINVDDDNDDNTDYEITVTTNDLRHVRQSPITVQQTNITTPPKVKGHEGSKVKRSTKDEVKVKEDKKLPEQKSKIVFKVPDPNVTKPTPLPDITEPVNNKKHPPTYTGNSPPKPKQSIGSDLLGQFKSARENAVRSAAKKQDRALKSVVALTRMGRTPSPTKKKPQPENLPDKNADRIINSKSTKNHEIYEKSKPKANRASPVESSRTSVLSSSTVTGRKEESDGSGRRERSRDDRRGRSHGRSRDDHDRRDHGSPSRRRGRSRSRDREIEPRERSRERELDRDERARKSQRDIYHRAVSPYKHHPEDPPYPRREPPYPRSRDPRSDEPDWVEEFRRRRANDDDHVTRRAWVNDPRWKDKRREFDINEYERDVRKATSYNSDFEQPQRKQMFPSKLMAKGNPPPGRKHPGGNPRGNNDWMRDLKENNKKAAKNRFR